VADDGEKVDAEREGENEEDWKDAFLTTSRLEQVM